MAGTTPIYNWPYPTGGDPVAQGDNDIQALAQDIETTLSAGVWQAFTPSFTNVTVGDGTAAGRYTVIGGTLFVRAAFTLGATSAIGTGPTMTLPATLAAVGTPDTEPVGSLVIADGTVRFVGALRLTSATEVGLFAQGVGSTYATATQVTATVPMTWASGDSFALAFAVEVS